MTARKCLRIGLALALLAAGLVAWHWNDLFEKKVRVVVAGRLIRGAWQRPWPLRRVIEREKIRTIVTLTAINRDDPKYVMQDRVVRETGVDWIIVPMRGSTATLDQLAEAADLLADPSRQPVFFHCVGGHHRTGLTQAAYRIRHEGWTAEQAWNELAALPWTDPVRDADDRQLIERFAARERRRQAVGLGHGGEPVDEAPAGSQVGEDQRLEPGPARVGRRPAGRLSEVHG